MTSLRKYVEEKNVCSLPWLLAEVQLHKHYLGPCCKYDENLGSLQNTELPIVWFGDKFKNFRQKMLDGVPLDGCKTCYISENVFSYKDKKNKDFSYMLDKIDVDAPSLPKIVHVGLTNICNLACRMCNPNQSSKLHQFINKSSNLKSFYPVFYADNKVDPKNLKGSFAETEIVTFMGGEPMIDESCLEILKMIKAESTQLREITFITNFTSLNKEILDIVNSLNVKVTLSVSIDGPPRLQEYIRHFAKWDDIFNNMQYVRRHYPRFIFGSNSTISLLNVGYVTDTISFFHSLQKDLSTRFEFVQPSVVTDKEFLFPGNLPDDIKKLYIDRIDSYEKRILIPSAEQLLSSARGLLLENPKTSFDTFINFITEFDKFAGTSYLDFYPEFGALTKNRT